MAEKQLGWFEIRDTEHIPADFEVHCFIHDEFFEEESDEGDAIFTIQKDTENG